MISFLTLPIRLVGILLMAAFLLRVMEPLRSFELKLSSLAMGSDAAVIAKTAAPASEVAYLLPIGLSFVAIISIWLVYKTYRQHMGLANNELHNRRMAKKIRL